MLDALKPLKAESLKDGCVERLEGLILSGRVRPKEKLPPERDLARHLGVSRPVIHDALVDLAAKGLVSLIPRVGTVVNDYRTHGSLALLTTLVNYRSGTIDSRLLDSLLAMRILFETETARLAAAHHTDDTLNDLKQTLVREKQTDPEDAARITQLDFTFHHQVAMASGNMAYPMFLNSFKPVYTHLAEFFFRDARVVPWVISGHEDLVNAIGRRDKSEAGAVMRRLLDHGETHLRSILPREGGPS